MKNKLFLLMATFVIILSIMACSLGDIFPGKATATPPVIPPVDTTPVVPQAGDLTILSTSSFSDGYSGYYVFGEVSNNSSSAVTSVELTIEITDGSGASLLKDDNGNPVNSLTFYPMLWVLDSGESSPFSYYFDTTNGIPANYNVTVTNFENSTVNRGQLQSENVQIIDDGSGYYNLTGEIVNLSNQWVHINGLAGGVLDDANTVLSADWTGTYTGLLAPAGDAGQRDRTPFYVSMPVPTSEATQWSLWWDADLYEDVTDYAVVVNVTNSYFDEYGSAHVVGLVSNQTDQPLSSLVVVGLYAEDGTTLDAGYSFLPVPVWAGTEVPFEVSYFGSVNWNEEQAALVSSYTAQIDQWSTYPPFTSMVAIDPVGETIQKTGSTWTVTGSFSNESGSPLTGVTVVTSVYDATNTLMAMGYTYVYPTGEVYATGEGGSYEITIYLDPSADTSGYTTQTYIVGDVSE
jgi:hypothetical protein